MQTHMHTWACHALRRAQTQCTWSPAALLFARSSAKSLPAATAAAAAVYLSRRASCAHPPSQSPRRVGTWSHQHSMSPHSDNRSVRGTAAVVWRRQWQRWQTRFSSLRGTCERAYRQAGTWTSSAFQHRALTGARTWHTRRPWQVPPVRPHGRSRA